MEFSTEQEEFWAGVFGDDYIARNQGRTVLAGKIALFSNIIQVGSGITSCLELGSNIGLNLKALQLLCPDIELSAVEINEKAAKICAGTTGAKVFNESILNFHTDDMYDLTFTSGVLIHINPEKLNDVYDVLYNQSRRYILVNEYYNPTPVEVNYRGNKGRLFKRDFAGEIMDRFPDLKLVDYGFVYHRDNNFPSDDCTWFLMEK